VRAVLTMAYLGTLAPAPVAADHSDVMAFLSGGALSMSLSEFDGCHFDGARPRAHDEMTEACRTVLEPCHSRMHLEEGEVPRDIGRRVLLERCLREDGGRFHILLQRHTIEVLGLLPDDVDEATRAGIVMALVQEPQEAARAAYTECLSGVSDTGRVAVGAQRCARAWRYDQLVRSRQAVKEALQ
jgi:hypothetical protein